MAQLVELVDHVLIDGIAPLRPVEPREHAVAVLLDRQRPCHGRRKSLIELEGADDDDGAESEANNFAKKTILRGRQRELLKLSTRKEIEEFAVEVGIHAGLAAAIRAYDADKDAWRIASKLRRKLDVTTL